MPVRSGLLTAELARSGSTILHWHEPSGFRVVCLRREVKRFQLRRTSLEEVR